MLSHVFPQCLVTDRIPIKPQLTGKSSLIFKLSLCVLKLFEQRAFSAFPFRRLLRCVGIFAVFPKVSEAVLIY